jgi:hypothetical protein
MNIDANMEKKPSAAKKNERPGEGHIIQKKNYTVGRKNRDYIGNKDRFQFNGDVRRAGVASRGPEKVQNAKKQVNQHSELKNHGGAKPPAIDHWRRRRKPGVAYKEQDKNGKNVSRAELNIHEAVEKRKAFLAQRRERGLGSCSGGPNGVVPPNAFNILPNAGLPFFMSPDKIVADTFGKTLSRFQAAGKRRSK